MSWLSSLLRAFNPFSSGGLSDSEYDLRQIPLNKIVSNPYQPRSHIDEDKLEDLARSIREYGVITPIQVTEINEDEGQYQLVAGERRVRACRSIGLKTIPALVRDFTEEEMIEVSFLENLQREPMSQVDKATMYSRLRSEFQNLSVEQLSDLIGQSAEEIQKHEWILDLPTVTKQALARGLIDESLARELDDFEVHDQKQFISFLVHEDPGEEEIQRRLSSLRTTGESADPGDRHGAPSPPDSGDGIPGEIQERG